LSPKGEAAYDGISPEVDVNGEWDCMATKLRSGNLQCSEMGTALAQSGPLYQVWDLRTGK
jgi:hypothetical protein